MANVNSAEAQNNVEKIAAQISELTVVEVCDLVKHLEEQYGVSAQAAVAAAPTTMTPDVELHLRFCIAIKGTLRLTVESGIDRHAESSI